MDTVHEIIIRTLSDKSKALTITEIARYSGLNRHTVARQLDTMELLGKVRKIHQGNAKKYYLVLSVQVSGLIDISSDLVVVADTDLMIHYINTPARKKLGIEGDLLEGTQINILNIDLFSSEEIINGLKNYSPNKVFRTEISQSDGSCYRITVLGFSLMDGKNLIAITAEDITEKKANEQPEIESEAKYHALFEANPDPVFLSDQETGKIIDANLAATRVYGYRYDELIRLSLSELSAKHEKTEDTLHQSSNQDPLIFHKNKTGRIFPVEINTCILTLKGKTHLLTISKDITRSTTAKRALKENEELFRSIVENIDAAFWVADPAIETMYYISPGYERIWGSSGKNHYKNQRPFLDAIHEEDRKRILGDYQMKNNGMPFEHEYRILRPGGAIRYIVNRGFPVIDNDGNISWYVGMATDITDLIRERS